MFKNLLQYYLTYFQTHGEPALITICNCKIPSDVVLSEYKKMPSIETLSAKDKNELWEYAKFIYPNADEETRLRFIRITYTIGNLI